MILFDLGRVLADLGSPSTKMRLTISDDEFWEIWLSMPAVRAFERGDVAFDEFLPRLAQKLGIREDPLNFKQRFLDWCPVLYPWVDSMISSLAKECKLALLSNTNPLHWNMIREETTVFQHFKHVFLSYELRHCKPEEGAFDIVLKAASASPKDVLFLDDMQENVAVARRLGFQASQVIGHDEVRDVLLRAGFEIE